MAGHSYFDSIYREENYISDAQKNFLLEVLYALPKWGLHRDMDMKYRAHIRNTLDKGYYHEMDRIIINQVREKYIEWRKSEKE